MAVGFEGSAGNLRGFPEIKSVSFFVNNMCNLRCPYCYLSGINSEAPVEINADETLGFIKKIHEYSRLENVSIVGREPTLSPKTTFAMLNGLREMNIPKIGIITNGTLITKKYAKKLAELVSFVDVSVDGLQDVHEATRGKGNFAKTISGIRYLLDAGADVFVLHKVDGASAPQLSEFAQFLRNDVEVKNLHMFPLYPNEIDISVFMGAIEKLVSDPPPAMLISVKADYFDGGIFPSLTNYVRQDVKKISMERITFVEKAIGNGSALRIMLEAEPAEFDRGLRIDHLGRLVFCADQARGLNRPVGNILEDPSEIFSRIELIKKIRAEYMEHTTIAQL